MQHLPHRRKQLPQLLAVRHVRQQIRDNNLRSCPSSPCLRPEPVQEPYPSSSSSTTADVVVAAAVAAGGGGGGVGDGAADVAHAAAAVVVVVAAAGMVDGSGGCVCVGGRMGEERGGWVGEMNR